MVFEAINRKLLNGVGGNNSSSSSDNDDGGEEKKNLKNNLEEVFLPIQQAAYRLQTKILPIGSGSNSNHSPSRIRSADEDDEEEGDSSTWLAKKTIKIKKGSSSLTTKMKEKTVTLLSPFGTSKSEDVDEENPNTVNGGGSNDNELTMKRQKSLPLPPMTVLEEFCDDGQAEIVLRSRRKIYSSPLSSSATYSDKKAFPRSPPRLSPRQQQQQQKKDSMTLKLIRGKDFPTIEDIPTSAGINRLELRLGHVMMTRHGDNDDDHADTVHWFQQQPHQDQTTERNSDYHHHEIQTRSLQVFGGPYYTWNLEASYYSCSKDDHDHDNDDDDQIIVLLVDNNLKTGVAREIAMDVVSVSELLRKHKKSNQNPNHWMTLQEEDTDDTETTLSFGSVQIRLALEATATVHEQETCTTISAGPGLIQNQQQTQNQQQQQFVPWKSYAVRKLALWSTTPVMLNVYDVSNESKIENLNGYIKAVGAGGIFHAAIEVYGREWSFGGTRNRKTKKTQHISGVFSSIPKQCPMHHYRETIYLGDCHLSHGHVTSILNDMKPQWLAHSYNLFRKNCCFFSREFAIELGVGDIPEWVYSLATSAGFIEPYLLKLEKYLTERAVAKQQQAAAAKREATKHDGPSSPKQKQVVQDYRGHAKPVVPSPPPPTTTRQAATATISTPPAHVEMILDHAMAAKIQRSFRHRSSRRGGMLSATSRRRRPPTTYKNTFSQQSIVEEC